MNRIGTRLGSGIGIALVAVVLVGCGAASRDRTADAIDATSSPVASVTTAPPTITSAPATTAAPTTSTPATTIAPSSTFTTTTAPTSATSPPAAPPIGVGTVTAAQLGRSWHAGCPVGPSQLRRLTVPYWGFDGKVHQGQLVVNADAVPAISSAFRALYLQHFPIRKMVTIDHYAGTGVQLDDESTSDDNTAAFNCRNAVNPGGAPAWSEHAYGEAVDVNPVENPYVESNGVVDPPNGATFVNRADRRAGMAYAGSPLNAAFAAVGWSWGGNWSGNPDYQHFSVNGQ